MLNLFALAEAEDWDDGLSDEQFWAKMRARSEAWQLLLAIDHDDRLRTDFGDGGGLYIGPRTEDVARGDFSRVDGTTQSG